MKMMRIILIVNLVIYYSQEYWDYNYKQQKECRRRREREELYIDTAEAEHIEMRFFGQSHLVA